MTPEVSAIVVSHRSAAEASACVASLQRAFAEEGIAGEVVLVDCGSGEEEADRLRAIPADRHRLLPENRGYAGGVNAGLAQARASRLLLTNADIVFAAGAVTALLAAIRERTTGAAAPLAVWDSESKLRLPPGFAPGFFRDLAQLQSGRLRALDDRRFASFARAARRLWERGGRARHLSGAVLAVRRDVFDAAGRFDERFPFEYEETERKESQRRYRRRRYGRLGRSLLEKAERFPSPAHGVTRLALPSLPARPGAAVALSPNPSGLPFAAADLSEEFRLPDEVAAGLAPGPWYLTVFRTADGRPIQRFLWLKAPA